MSIQPRLSALGYLVIVVIAILIVASGGYLGWYVGAIWGLANADPILNAPSPPGVGLAPNLAPLVDAGFELVTKIAIGFVVGILTAGLLAWCIARYVLAPWMLQSTMFRYELDELKNR